jgi:dihydropteroate synthase
MNPKNTPNFINYTLNCNGKLIVVDKPIVMGIINITPDSFYAESRQQNIMDILATAKKMVTDGATILDMGAQSTRPNSSLLTWEQEWERLEIPLQEIRNHFPEILISIDTFYSQVAKNAVANGADMINDISGGQMDSDMITTVGKLNVPYICMHMQGTPQTMQENPTYDEVTKEVLDYFIAKKFACEAAGIKDIIFDVGFGFGKTIQHNFTLLNDLHIFSRILQKPILAGLSRKSMIYKTLHCTPEESLNGTTVLNTIALQNGASILRVHDVKEAVEVVSLCGK